MKTTVTKSDFCHQFAVMNRTENFSYEARELLFDYFEELEQDTGEEMEMDVIAVCCEFSEDSPEDIAGNYNIDISECADADEIQECVMDYLNDHTIVVGGTSNGIVYAQF